MRMFKAGDIVSADVNVLFRQDSEERTALRVAAKYIETPFNQSFREGYLKPHPVQLIDDFCVEVPDAVLYGERAVVTRDDILSVDYRAPQLTLDVDSELMQPTTTVDGHYVSERVDKPQVEVNERVCLLSSQEHGNYGATLIREIPKLVTLRRLGLSGLPVVSPASPWHRELLEIFGVKKIVPHDRHSSYYFKQLIVPGQKNRSLYFGEDVVQMFDEVAGEIFGATFPKPDTPLLYVSRISQGKKNPDYRRCLNEEELAGSLSQAGFKIIEPESHSIREQIAFFRAARFVVGPSGAGMFNTVFCRPGTDVLSIEPVPTFVYQHCNLYGSMGHSYGLVTGGAVADDPTIVQKAWKADIPVVMRRVEEVMRKLACLDAPAPARRDTDGGSPERRGARRNRALGKPALQSSISEWSTGTPAEDAQGGNNGLFSRPFGFHTGTERNPWWQVDLEEPFLVRRVVIFNRKEQAQRLNRFTLLGSPDGMNWKELYRKDDDRVFGYDGKPFTAGIAGNHRARFVRVRLDGEEPLHFVECQVFGERPGPVQQASLRSFIPHGRLGRVVEIDGLAVFIDDEDYDRKLVAALERGDYEAPKRQLLEQLVTRTDRVIVMGTGIGVVAMTAARIVGACGVLTFEANPDLASDARDNFTRNGLSRISSHIGVMKNRQAIDSDKTKMILDGAQIPTFCLEEAIHDHQATVLLCDIAGAEAELLNRSDVSAIRLITIETHYGGTGEWAVDAMVRHLIMCGFSIHLGLSRARTLVLRRRTP